MEIRRSRVIELALAGMVGLMVVAGVQGESEANGYRYLCTSVPGACDYAPADAPVLNADVCSDGTTTVLKGASDCDAGSYPFLVRAGEVLDPQTGEVQAYIPLDDACDMGYCLPKAPGDPPGEAGPMCCDVATGDCTTTGDGTCPASQIALWCPDGQSGTYNDGEWICSEAD